MRRNLWVGQSTEEQCQKSEMDDILRKVFFSWPAETELIIVTYYVTKCELIKKDD